MSPIDTWGQYPVIKHINISAVEHVNINTNWDK